MGEYNHYHTILKNTKWLILTALVLFSQLNFAQSNIDYVKNIGQWDDFIHYKADVGGGYLFVEQDRITFVVSEANKIHSHGIHEGLEIHSEDDEEPTILGSFSYQMEFLEANLEANIISENKAQQYYNYFLGNEPNKWQSNVPLFKKVIYQNIYDGIDLMLYSRNDLFEYDFIIHPGADLSQIKIRYNGIENITTKNGQLQLPTPLGLLTELAPVVYQNNSENRTQLKAIFTIEDDNVVSFKMAESYNLLEDLIIDPVLIFSTYSGSFSDNWGFTATYDNDGNLYSGGMVSGNGYPATIGAYDTLYNGGVSFTQTDIAISKYSPDGVNLIYATYIGGIENEIPHSLIVNESDELIIYGTTGSENYPVTLNAFDKTFNGGNGITPSTNIGYPNGSDIIVTKLNASGSNLLGSTFFGGSGNDGINTSGINSLEYNYGDYARGDIALTDDEDIIITSCTFSDDIPQTTNSFQSIKDENISALVAKFNADLSQLEWASYFGGEGDDASYSIEILDNEIIIGGGTNSADLNGISGLNTSFQGGQADGFILKISSDGTTLINGTYLGTSEYDQVYFLETDIDGNIYALGQTIGDFPVSPDVYSVPNATQFIQAFTNDLSQLNYSTVFGSQNTGSQTKSVNISPTAFLVDNCKNIYAIGWGGNVNNGYNFNTGTTDNLETTADAFQTETDGSDFYLLVIDNNKDLLFGSYFGELGGTGDHVDGGTSRFDKNGFVYHASCASCGGSQGFPTTGGVWSNSNNSNNCNTASFKVQFDFAPIEAATDADPISGCPPLEVQFTNFSNITGEFYFWDFDDGGTSQEENPVYTFNDPGIYDVEFIIIDSSNCIVSDTANIQIIVSDTLNQVVANFEINDTGCLRTNLLFNNLSENANTYLWDFGDGSTSEGENPIHDYASAGNYTVTLIADPGSGCSDTFSSIINVFENTINANYQFGLSSCSGNTLLVDFIDSSNSDFGIESWLWDFGDGNTSSEQNPTYEFDSSGSYSVSLIVTDSVGCVDFIAQTVFVNETPFSADFSVISNCDPFSFGTQFNDLSGENNNIIEWQWDFGDAVGGSTVENPLYFYGAEGDYQVTLFVTNDLGCVDSITKTITVQTVNINVNFEIDSAICASSIVSFLNTSTPEDSIVSYLWDFGDGTNSTEENPTHDFINVGSYFITLTATTLTGCESSFSLFYAIPIVEVDITVIPPLGCSNLNEVFFFGINGTSSNAVDLTQWDFGDGSPPVIGFNVSHQYTDTGTYTVEHIITNIDGCVDTNRLDVIISDEATVNIEANAQGCESLTFNFNQFLSVPDNIETITWDFGDGTTLSDSLNPSHTYADTGSYTISVNVTTSSGCTGSGTTLLEVILENIDANFDVKAEDCNPFIVDFENQSLNNTTVSYNWNFGDGTTSSIENPQHIYVEAGTYTVTLIVSSPSNCVDTISQQIKIDTKNILLSDSLSICLGDSILLPLSTNLNATYQWSPATSLNASDILQPIAFPTSTTNYEVLIEEVLSSGDTCRFMENIVVTVNNLPEVIATSNQYIVSAGTIVDLSATSGFNNYSWSPSVGLSNPNEDFTTAEIINDIIFEVSVTDENGCTNSDTVNIILQDDACNLESLFIPNAFSPNGDGQNDKLFVRVLGNIDRMDFSIYNRWGELVFRTDDINEGWDGNSFGKLQSTDVFGYFLEVECEGIIEQRKGNITLVR